MFLPVFKQLALQKFRYIQRLLRDEKLSPFIVLPVIVFLFGYLSYFIILKKHSVLLYTFIALYILIFKTISKEKEQFYRQQFSPKTVYWLQMIELCLVALPFILFLLMCQYVLYALFIIIIIAVFPLFNIYQFNFSFTKVIPAPYLKESYEMNFGFRSAVILTIVLIFPYIMSIYVGNANLFFGIIVIYCCIQAFISYSVFEDAGMLRQYFLSPSKIIFIKFRQIVINHLIPLSITFLCSLFFKELRISLITLLIILLSILYNWLLVLLKYIFFQHDFINAFFQVLLLAVFFIVPAMPITALILPFLYYILFGKAVNGLKQILS